MRSALATLDSPYQVAFDLDRDEVYVAYDARAGAAKEASAPMIAAIKAAGFEPWLKREGWPEPAPEVMPVPKRKR